MGQKVSPIGMRVGVIRDWDSRWYANKADFGDLLNEDVKVRNFLEKELKDAYISRVEIERTSKKDVKVIVRCARPGAMLGKDGDKDKMEVLKKKLSKLTGGKNVKVDVIAVNSWKHVSPSVLHRRRQFNRQCALVLRALRHWLRAV